MFTLPTVEEIERDWTSARWRGIERPYTAKDIEKLRGTARIEHSLARMGATRLWDLLHSDDYLPALGALTGNQAIQQVEAGLKVIYVSGWQVAADMNSAGQMYPDQSLYPADSVPSVVRRINNAFQRADQIQHADGRKHGPYWFAPIVADAEAGFGGPLNAFELMKAMIEAGAAGVHFEDQLASAKKCGHMGGKVLVPVKEAVQKLIAARFAADVMEVPTIIIGRTDALGAQLITSDVDERDWRFIDHSKGRTSEGFWHLGGDPMQRAIERACAYAPYCDLLWFETSEPNMHQAWEFADRVHLKFPGKRLAYNCSPSFNWKKKLCDVDIYRFQDELGKMGYSFQFVTLAGFHALSYGMFDLASDYLERGMAAYAELQQREFAGEQRGYTATKHQHEVGTGYFDAVANTISGGKSSTLALAGSTETEQFAQGGVGSSHGSEEGLGAQGVAAPADVGAVPDPDGAAPPAGPFQRAAAPGRPDDSQPDGGEVGGPQHPRGRAVEEGQQRVQADQDHAERQGA